MNRFQRKLRLLIAAGSTMGFLGGWALLAHAGKPVSTVTTAPTVESVTLPPIDFSALENSGSSTSVRPLTLQVMPQSFSRPRLRTGGS
jgi:hypothetical protein